MAKQRFSGIRREIQKRTTYAEGRGHFWENDGYEIGEIEVSFDMASGTSLYLGVLHFFLPKNARLHLRTAAASTSGTALRTTRDDGVVTFRCVTSALTAAHEHLAIGNLELPVGADPTSWRRLVRAMGNRSETELANPNAVY